MRVKIPSVLLILSLSGLSCSTQSQRDFRPRVPSPHEAEGVSTRPAPSATPIVEEQPETNATSDLPSTTTSLAEAAAPEAETNSTETAPTVNRTSVVVGNGRIAPIRSFWLRFPAEHVPLKSLVAYTIAHSKAKGESFQTWIEQGFHTFCAENTAAGENESLSFLFSRYAHILYAEGIRSAESTDTCKRDKIPRFKDRVATVTESSSAPKAPGFLCTYDRSEKEWLLGFDLMNADGSYALHIQSMNSDPWNFASADLLKSQLHIDDRGQPTLVFSGEWGELQLYPYQTRSEAFLGRTMRQEEANQDLKCRLSF